MKCPKCGYTSFDYLKECKKCGENLEESRRALNLKVSEPILFNKNSPSQEDSPPNQGSKTQKTLDELPETIDFSLTDDAFSKNPPASFAASSPTPATEKNSPDDFFSDLGSLENEVDLEPPSQQGEFELNQLPEFELENNLQQDNEIELSPAFIPQDSKPEKKYLRDEEIVLLPETDMKKHEVRETNDHNTLEDDLPFSFTNDSSMEAELNFDKSFVAMEDDKFTELELDLEDEESLDQILADLEKKK